MLTQMVTIGQPTVREILAHYIRTTYGVNCMADEIRFDVKQGYNGEMGGTPYPTEVAVNWEGQ